METQKTKATNTRWFFLLVTALVVGVCYAVWVYGVQSTKTGQEADTSISNRSIHQGFGSGERPQIGSGDMSRFGSGDMPKFGSGERPQMPTNE